MDARASAPLGRVEGARDGGGGLHGREAGYWVGDLE